MKKFNLKEELEVIKYLEKIDFPGYYKKSNNFKTWIIDQKVTFDVINITSKCIMNWINYDKSINEQIFHHKDFLEDEYSKEIYAKRTSDNGKAKLAKKTSKEYDKLFWNIFNFLTYIEILEKVERNHYKIINYSILKLLSESQESCVAILCHSILKLIKSTSLINDWNFFVSNQNKENINMFKRNFFEWMINTTKHRSDISQIFQKVVNPLFYLFDLKKYQSNKNTRNLKQSLNDLTYFKIHRRDKNKPPFFTRYENKLFSQTNFCASQTTEERAKKLIKKWNQEYYDLSSKSNFFVSELSSTKIFTGVHVHHIWPKMEEWNDLKNGKSIISPNMFENFIILSHNEHFGTAHNKGNVKILNFKTLSLILWKQYEKILNYNEKNIGKYDLTKFYQLLCFIKNIEFQEEENFEILKQYCEEIISI